MLVKDGLNLLNLTQAEIAAYDAGIFLDEGSLLYDSTNNQVTVYNGTQSVPVKGGYEGFQEQTTILPFQVNSLQGSIQGRLLNSATSSSITSPMCFQQDVNLISVSANLAAASNNVTGYVGIYELNSKATTSGVNYYEFNKLHQLTSTINWVSGAAAQTQILTLSTPYTLKAGKIYVVTTVNDYIAGSQPQLYGVRKFGFNKLLSVKPFLSTAFVVEYALQLSDTFAAPYTFSFASAGVLPNTIWFQGVTTNSSASNMLSLTVQNA